MLISNEFEVAQPLDAVWTFFGDVPQVAACLPGADLTEDLGDDTYGGRVGIRMGPVRLEFAGKAKILERDDAAKRLVLDASGSDLKGRGQAAMTVTATLSPAGSGTKVHLDQDLQLSGAAAQYGRGMISDVTTVLMGQFADNAQRRITAIERGESLDDLQTRPASGLSIGLQAARMALMRVFRRFFLPYRSVNQPNPS
jgi:carbon monoxide dehydrogenase subunit G